MHYRPTGKKYQQYFYCPYCRLWISKESPEITVTPKGLLKHLRCGRRLRPSPRKKYANPSSPRIDPDLYLVTPVTTPSRRR